MSLVEPDLDSDDVDELVDPLPVRVKRALTAEVWPGWWVGAPCGSADPDAWFPEFVAAEQVLRTCQACPLRRPCLAAGIVHNEHGVWGGTLRLERRQARRDMAAGRPVPLVLDDVLHDAAAQASGDPAGFGAAA
jgi:hypothetical protein